MAARVASRGQVPVVIGTDLNINPGDSNALVSATFDETIHDLFADRLAPADPPNTFYRKAFTHNVTGVGTSRLDTLLGNEAASRLVGELSYMYSKSFWL